MRTRGLNLRCRDGVALLEAIVALLILATAGVAMLGATSQAIRATRVARDADRTMRDADALLNATALWPREELDQRLGSRPQGALLMRIDRVLWNLYVVSLRDSSAASDLLRTTLYRPLAADATR